MKTVTNCILVLMILVFMGCAGSSSYMQPATTVLKPTSDKAVVYFMRPSGIGFAINFQIWDGERFIGLSQAKSYFAYQCDPGRHLFVGLAENKRGLEADLEAGKAYFAITQVRMGGWRARMAFIPVTRGSEFWDLVNTYMTELNYIEAKPGMLMQWEAKHRAKTQEVLAVLNSPEGRQYVLRLNKSDGR